VLYKKHNWIPYGKKIVDKTAELRINQDGKTIDRATWALQDKDSERKIFTIFKHKHGLFKKQEDDLKNIK